jgi:hypothetical protein
MIYFAEYKDQLLALGVILGSPCSKNQAIADLKVHLDEEKADVLSRAVCDPKISADSITTQIPTIEDKVKHLEDKFVEGLKEVRA